MRSLLVIIVSFNTKEFLEKCLRTVLAEVKASPQSKIEVLVIDNASVDGSAEMVREKFPSIKLTVNKENQGFAKAVNQGLRQIYTERSRSGRGEVILLLNSDTQLTKGSLEKLLDFEEEVCPAIIGARLINLDGTVQPSVFRLPSLKRAIEEYWLGKKGYFSKYTPSGSGPQEVESVSGGAMLISREVIEKIGLLDERYFMYFEDLDYCRRAARAGFKIYYLPTAEIIHEHGASGRQLAEEKNQWRRLIPSSKIYYGCFRHWLISLIIKLGRR